MKVDLNQIADGYPPNVLFHGIVAGLPITVGDKTRIVFDHKFVLNSTWYDAETGVFTGEYIMVFCLKSKFTLCMKEDI